MLKFQRLDVLLHATFRVETSYSLDGDSDLLRIAGLVCMDCANPSEQEELIYIDTIGGKESHIISKELL